jgi:hypothetical protein
MQIVSLSETPDRRCIVGGQAFSTKAAYSTMYKAVDDPALNFVWSSRVPNRVNIFLDGYCTMIN